MHIKSYNIYSFEYNVASINKNGRFNIYNIVKYSEYISIHMDECGEYSLTRKVKILDLQFFLRLEGTNFASHACGHTTG